MICPVSWFLAVTLPPTEGEDAGKVQTLSARFAQGEITLEERRGAGLPGVRIAWRRLPVPECRDKPGRRGPGDDAARTGHWLLQDRRSARPGAALG